MKKFSKILSIVLAVALIAAVASVSVFAADPAISVKTAPARTVYYEGVDTYDGLLYCDPAGMVITLTKADGTTVDLSADKNEIYLDVESYVLGENTATVYYFDENGNELTTTYPITVKESPVASVKVTKMPNKTEYDMDKDVFSPDNFDLDKVYATAPDYFDAIFAELGITFEQFKEECKNNPEMMDVMKEAMFADYKNILMVDTAGMEIEVTFKDGTTQTLNDEQEYLTYDGVQVPVLVDQPTEIKEGKNTLTVSVAGVKAPFDVTVKKAASVSPDKPVEPSKPDDVRNPEIPNTDGGVSLALAGVIALVSGFGAALVPSKKKEQF